MLSYTLMEIQHVHLTPMQKHRAAADPILPDQLMLTTVDATDCLPCKKTTTALNELLAKCKVETEGSCPTDIAKLHFCLPAFP